MANTDLFRDPLYTQSYNTAMGLLDPNSPQSKQALDTAMGQVSKAYSDRGVAGSGQEYQAIADTAKNLNFNQSLQAINASQMPISNWMAAQQLKQAQETGDIQLASAALAALGIPQAMAKGLFGVNTQPTINIGGGGTPTTPDYGIAGNAIRKLYNQYFGDSESGLNAEALGTSGVASDVGLPSSVADIYNAIPDLTSWAAPDVTISALPDATSLLSFL